MSFSISFILFKFIIKSFSQQITFLSNLPWGFKLPINSWLKGQYSGQNLNFWANFNVFCLPNQIHSDNGCGFVNMLWQELFLELKILHTNTPPNMIERCYRTIMSILKTMGREMQEEWDLGVKAACLAYITTVHTGIGQTQFFATFGREARAGHVLTFLKSFRSVLFHSVLSRRTVFPFRSVLGVLI